MPAPLKIAERCESRYEELAERYYTCKSFEELVNCRKIEELVHSSAASLSVGQIENKTVVLKIQILLKSKMKKNLTDFCGNIISY